MLKTPVCGTLFVFWGSVYKVIGRPEYSHMDGLQREVLCAGEHWEEEPAVLSLQRLEGDAGTEH